MSRRLVAVSLGPTVLAVLIAGCHGPPPSSRVDPEAGVDDGGARSLPFDAGVDGGAVPPEDAGDAIPDAGVTDFDLRELQKYVVPPNTTVRVEGVVVTGVRHATNYSHLFVQEPEGDPQFSGVHVFLPDLLTAESGAPQVGDLVNLRGRVGEYGNPNYWGSHTALSQLDHFEIVGTAEVPEPVTVAQEDLVGGGTDNPWQSVLVRVEDAQVVAINEREELVLTSELIVDDALYEFELPDPGTGYGWIVGPLHHDYGGNRLLPRGAEDFAPPR